MPADLVRIVISVLLLFGAQQLGGAGLIHAKAWLAPKLIERAWQQSLAAGNAAVKPWPWADTWPLARLQVPSLGVDQFVLAGDSGNALAFSPGHVGASAPLGSAGRAVVGGHRDTHFAFLEDLSPGDRLILELPGGRLRRYRVDALSVVDTSRQRLENTADADELLLVTCYPFDAIDSSGPLRYVVVARTDPVNYLPQASLWPTTGGFSL
jgi:sortase A